MSSHVPSFLPLAAATLTAIWACAGGEAQRGDSGEASRDLGDRNAGAKVASQVPTASRPSNACGWIPVAEAETILGPLSEAPVPLNDEECRYVLSKAMQAPLDARQDSLEALRRKLNEKLRAQGADEDALIRANVPDSAAVIVRVDLKGAGFGMEAVGKMTEKLFAGALGEAGTDTEGGATKPAERPAGWDYARPDTIGRPGFLGRIGHITIEVTSQTPHLEAEKTATLAVRVRDRIPDLPFPTTRSGRQPWGADPCSVLTREEAEAVLGKLIVPPYRSDEGSAQLSSFADPGGQSCAYYTAGHHVLVLTPEWENAKQLFKVTSGIGGLLSTVISDNAAEAADTLEGLWDQASTGPDGALTFLKGDRMIELAFALSSTDAAGAVRLARKAVERLAASPGARP